MREVHESSAPPDAEVGTPKRKRGPRTAAGKARSSRNAIKHGIMSPHPVIIELLESEEEWDEFRDGIVESYAPVGALEQELADTIAFHRWRHRRVFRFETAVINFQVHSQAGNLLIADSYLAEDKANLPDPDPRVVAIHQERNVIPKGSDLEVVLRYEAHLQRLFQQTHHELEVLQSRRLGRPVTLSRLDMTTSPRQFGPPAEPSSRSLLDGLS